jgi:carboxyl-terminal processing protease
MRKLLFCMIVLSAGLLSACKKDKKTVVNNGNVTPVTGTPLQLMQDSVYLYAKEDYLWNTSLPSYDAFNPRSFKGSNDIGALSAELDALSQYAINPATSKPYEYYAPSPGHAKYSFIDDGSVTAGLNGVKGDFGFGILYNQVNDLRVKFVYPGSPADLAGIKRGYQITSINGDANISYDATGYGTGNSTNLNRVINAYSNSGTISMNLTKQDGTTLTVTNLNTASYTVNPVLKETVVAAGTHKVGYLVFNSFTVTSNSSPKLNAAFDDFIAQGITDLVVDLRYNGGGSIATAEYLDNLIVPTAKNGALMYTTFYNSNLQNDIYPLLAKKFAIQKGDFKPANNQAFFSKLKTLNISRVFFIVTGSSASASELAINNLRPYMDVQLVGRTSYGKPVGFFGIPINKYILYTPELVTKNSANQGDYYAGFNPGIDIPGVNDFDDPTKDFGDPAEGLLAHILKYVQTGVYAVQSPATPGALLNRARFMDDASKMNTQLDQHTFNGMIFNKFKALK